MPVDLSMFRATDQRLGTILRPATPLDEALLRDAPFHRVVSASLTWPPPPKAQRWYRALLHKLVGAGLYQNGDEAHFDVMLKTHRAEQMVLHQSEHSATIRFKPASTAGWDGHQWRAFLRDAVEVVVKDVIPGMPIGQLRREVEVQVGIRFREALEET